MRTKMAVQRKQKPAVQGAGDPAHCSTLQNPCLNGDIYTFMFFYFLRKVCFQIRIVHFCFPPASFRFPDV